MLRRNAAPPALVLLAIAFVCSGLAASSPLTRAEMEAARGACYVFPSHECNGVLPQSCGVPGDQCDRCQSYGRFGWGCSSPLYVVFDATYDWCYFHTSGSNKLCRYEGVQPCGVEYNCDTVDPVAGYYCSSGDCNAGDPNDVCRRCERGDATGEYDQRLDYGCS